MPKKKKQLKFGRYEVESELGQGAMGKVYKAFDPLTQRPVAIKALKHEILAQDESGEYQKRFQREARAAGGLSHPHIITIFDVGENYFVMEYLEATNLLNLMAEKGQLSLDETLSIVSPIADALAYAHGRGVFHRDIKPANIMVFPDGRPVITDFGLAHLESTVMTAAGQFLGSPSYMSPEQVLGEDITPRADIFSLCVVTYEMLTGHKPFPGENVTSVIYKVVQSQPVPPHEFNAELPSEYEHIFVRALAKAPEQRFQSFSEFVAALNLEEFDRLGIPVQEQTKISVKEDVAVTPVTPLTDDEQETVSLPTPAAESKSSITERKRPSKMQRNALIAAAVFLLAMAAFLIPSFLADPVATGLGVETNPEGAEVWIDGELAGTSPFELDELTLGEHDVRITKDGFLPLEERFEISEADASEPLLFALQPERISLFLESVPSGAAVVINGAQSGTTPLEDFELAPGQHEIQVGRRGYETWRSVVVSQAGETVNLVARLRSTASKTAPAPASSTVAPKEAPTPAATEPTEPVEAGGTVVLGPDDKPAERISGKPPGYPRMARKLNQQGRVTVEFVLAEEGVPAEIVLLESAGNVLDQAVMDSLAEWRYTPAEKDGVPVRVKMLVRHTFRLGR